MKKRLSLILIPAVFLIIGGVFATWSYAQGNVDPQTANIGAELTAKVVTTQKGTINVTSNTLKVIIDDTDNNHIGDLVVEGELGLTFTAAEGADQTVVDSGIPMQFALAGPAGFQWGTPAVDVFTVDTSVQQINGGGATKTATITADEIKNLITLASISLPTAADYDSFAAALSGKQFTVTISEATTT